MVYCEPGRLVEVGDIGKVKERDSARSFAINFLKAGMMFDVKPESVEVIDWEQAKAL